MDLNALIRTMSADGSLDRIALNPRAQFGTRARRLLGAELLPEINQEQNEYTEEGITYRTIIANAGTRYSPAQKKGGALVGTMRVTLAEQDIASELTSRDYDALIRILGRGLDLQGVVQVTNFVNTTINMALVELVEVYRWQALMNALVQLRGDNEYVEDVGYSNPAGHRAAAAAQWSLVATDPFADIYAQAQRLIDKGFDMENGRIITSRKVASILAANPKVAARTNRVVVSSTGQISGVNGRISLAEINGAMAADGLPPIETYDQRYRTQTGSARFMDEDSMLLVAATGRDVNLDLGDTNPVSELVPNTVGYVGVGRPAGQNRPGRVIRAEVKTNKPPRVECEGWQTSLPVIQEPEALATIHTIS